MENTAITADNRTYATRLICAKLQEGSTYNQEWFNIEIESGYYETPLHALLDATIQSDGPDREEWIEAIQATIAAGEGNDFTAPGGWQYRYMFAEATN